MSTNRLSVVNGGAAATKPYFCHQCEAIVTVPIPPSPSDEIACHNCGGGFLEEYEENPSPNSQIPRQGFSFSFSSSGAGDGDEFRFNPAELTAALLGGLGGAGGAGGRRGVEEDVFDPMAFLNNYLASMGAQGANVQFVFENGGAGGGAGFGLPGNFGDYFVGPGLEQLIQQLAENDPNRYGTPPASKEAVEKLPDIKITEELMTSDNAQCAVCMDAFELGGKAKKMPCKHIFHGNCILPWLELHNSCPVCRYEMPTDDPEYEQRSAGGHRGNSTGGSGESSEDSAQARRMRVRLPWPLNAFGFGSDGSNSGGSPNDSRNSGGRSHQ